MPVAQGGGGLVTGSNIVDQSISDADISNSAAINPSKIAFGTGLSNSQIDPTLAQSVQVNLSSADILAGFVTPKTLIAAPGAGKLIIIENIVVNFTAGTQYTGGGVHLFRYNGDTVDLVALGTVGHRFTSAASVNYSLTPLSSGAGIDTLVTAGVNKAVEWSNGTGAYLTGTGTATMSILYRIITP